MDTKNEVNYRILFELIEQAEAQAKAEMMDVENSAVYSFAEVVRQKRESIEFLLAFHKKQGGSGLKKVADLFSASGITIDERVLHTTLSRMRKEASKPGPKKGKHVYPLPPSTIAPTVSQSHVPAIIQPIPVIAPVVHSVAHAMGNKPVWNWSSEQKRLSAEFMKKFVDCPWSETDELINQHFEEISTKYKVAITRLKTIESVRERLSNNEDVDKCLTFLLEKHKHFGTLPAK